MENTQMTDAIKEILQREVENTLEQAEKQREVLRRRVSSACDRIRRRQVLARSETLTPLFRSDFLKRGKVIQKIRARLLQTLTRYAQILQSGDIRATCGLLNVEIVLRVVREALVEEAELTHWQLPLPREEEWRAVCIAVKESCNNNTNNNNNNNNNSNSINKNTSASIVVSSSEQKQQEPLETALSRLLSPCNTNNDNEEAPMGTVSLMPWLSIPCFCSLAYYCRHPQMLIVATKDISRKDSSRREGDDETIEVEKTTMGDGDMALVILQAAAEHLRQLSGNTTEDEVDDDDVVVVGENNNNNNNNNGVDHESNDDKEEAVESAMEEARLRVCIEIAARATACKYAVESLSTGEDAILFDGVATVISTMMMLSTLETGTSHTLPFTTLVLPPMEQLFFCIAYTIGAAILRDEHNERCAGGVIVVDDNEEASDVNNNNSNNNKGWRSVFERWMLQERSANNTSVAFLGPRLLQYLLEYVFHPSPRPVQMGKPAEEVELSSETARRWLNLAFEDILVEKESAVDSMMTLFLNRQ